MILATAIAGDAECIVTGDKDLLVLGGMERCGYFVQESLAHLRPAMHKPGRT